YVVPATLRIRRTSCSRLFIPEPRTRAVPRQTGPRVADLLGRQAARVTDSSRHPTLKLALGFHTVGVNAQPAPGFPARHHHGADVVAFQELVGLVRRYPDEQAALPAGGHRHVAVDQEREATEHAFFLDATLGSQQFADPVGQVFVVGHVPTLTPTTDTRRTCIFAGLTRTSPADLQARRFPVAGISPDLPGWS